ncbi:MAG: hypothetical protein ABJB12_01140 [Pseudomonadota bacterium]
MKISSNNSQVVPNDAGVFDLTEVQGKNGVLELFGLSAGTAMVEARDSSGNVVTYVQVQVESIGGKHAYFKLAEPSMAINAPNSPVKYATHVTKTIPFGTDAADVLDLVAKQSNLRHLVMSCHGYGDPDRGPYLDLGSGFRDEQADLFAAIRPAVTGAIWIGACSVCGTQRGVDFCAKIAKASGCYVIAPGITLPPMKVAHSQIEVFTRSMPHYFARDGRLISQSAFLQLDKELGFTLLRVQ